MALRAEINQRKASKLENLAGEQAAAQSWIEAVTGKPFPEGDFAAALKDGTLLCELVNAIKPGTVKKINSSRLAFKQMENISHFIHFAKEIGVPAYDCFDTVDLYQENDMAKVRLASPLRHPPPPAHHHAAHEPPRLKRTARRTAWRAPSAHHRTHDTARRVHAY
jgi:hypothetical protein